jgi:hypothetical protein
MKTDLIQRVELQKKVNENRQNAKRKKLRQKKKLIGRAQ